MRSRATVAIALLAMAGALLIITPDSTEFLRNADAGSQLTKGYAILEGRHPFVDIDSSVYGPAIFYLSAAGQGFADGPASEWLIIIGGYLLAFALMFCTLDRRQVGPLLFWLFVVMCLVTLPAFHKYHVILPPAIYLACLAAADARRTAGSAGLWLGAGSAATGLFRLDFGAYAVLASLLFVILKYRNEGSDLRRAIVTMFGTGALLAGPWVFYLSLAVGPLESITRFTETTLGVYSGLAKPLPPFDLSDPFGRGSRLVVAFWSMRLLPWILLGLLTWRAFRTPVPAATLRHQAFLIAGAAAAALFYLQASHRIDLNHVQQVFAPVAFASTLGIAFARANQHRLAAASMLLVLLSATLLVAVDGRILRDPARAVASSPAILKDWFEPKTAIIDRSLQKTPHASPAYGIRRVRDLTDDDARVLFLPYSAQSYYFADRMFDTPFGWLNPGRFLRPGAEQRFIEAMDDTVLVVDDPAFSFDGRPERNMRSYAPRLSEHIYSRYGIVEVAGGTVLLSAEPAILQQAGRYALSLTPTRVAGRGHGTDETRTDPQSAHSDSIATVNTLPPSLSSGFRPVRMPPGGGLLLGLASRHEDHACALLASQDQHGRYRISDLKGGGVPWSAIGTDDLIDTRSIPPGRYRLLKTVHGACAPSDQGVAENLEPTVDTGVVIDIVAHFRQARQTPGQRL